MRFSTIALSLMALGVASIAAAPSSELPPVARDFERKMQVRDARKHNIEARNTVYKDGMLTWYSGSQLNNPSCGGKAPSKYDHVVAVKEGGPFHCGQKIHIHANGKMVSATVRDTCSSCAPHHLDLTQGLFEEFASLDAGEIHGAHLVPQ